MAQPFCGRPVAMPLRTAKCNGKSMDTAKETNGEEQHLWALNLLVDDVWISINATFLRDLSQAQPLVDAAIQVVR